MPNPKAGIYPCNICNKVFKYPGRLVTHLSEHISGDTQFICPTCSTHFETYQLLQQHYSAHLSPRFPCDFCSKDFGRPGQLERHTNSVHYQLRPHKCNFCGKLFTDPASLKRHSVTHSGARNYKCSNCGASSTTASNLAKHKKTRKCANNSYVQSTIQPLPDGNVATSTAHVVAISPTLVTTTASVATSSGITTITEHQHLGVGVTTVTAFSQQSPIASLQQPSGTTLSPAELAHRLDDVDNMIQEELAGSLAGNQPGLSNDNNLTTSVFYGVDFAASCPLDEIPEIAD